MKQKVSEHKIYETTDYKMFKKMDGNRPVKDGRVAKIEESINKVGYILSPILVNEKMEVIDGQGRLTALERLKMPVHYMVQNGVGIEECRQMNIHQSNWTDYDYISSYAIRGDESYQRLQSLIDSYKIPVAVIISAAANVSSDSSGGNWMPEVRDGKFKCGEKDYERAKWELDYAIKFKDVVARIGGTKKPFYMAVIYAYRNLNSSGRNRMESVIRKHQFDIPSLSKACGYLKYFDDYYNSGLHKKNRIKLAIQWELDHM